MVKVHVNNTKHITIANIYIPPRDSTPRHYKIANTDIQHCIQYITNIPHSFFTGYVNAHSTLWRSYIDDYRVQQIADVISNSDTITINTPNRVQSSASCHHTVVFYLSTQNFAVSLNFERSSKVQGRARRVHCSMCAVFSVARPHSHVIWPECQTPPYNKHIHQISPQCLTRCKEIYVCISIPIPFHSRVI